MNINLRELKCPLAFERYVRDGGAGAIANATFYAQGTAAQNVTAVAATDIAWSAGKGMAYV